MFVAGAAAGMSLATLIEERGRKETVVDLRSTRATASRIVYSLFVCSTE